MPSFSSRARADVVTDRPERWAKQLVEHLGRRVETTETDHGSVLSFDSGRGTVRPEEGRLVLVAEAADPESLERVKDVLGRHLERFAAREGLAVSWVADPASDGEWDVVHLLSEIESIGRDRSRGGYSRHVFDAPERELRDWFTERAGRLGLSVETDRNGNIWAWWGDPGADALAVGSHLDSVPGGGAFDGPLGVASALAVVSRLKRDGTTPARPFAVMVFAEEEGSRFGVACLGSRLISGAISGERAAALADASGRTFGEAARDFGLRVEDLGRDREALDRIGVFLELHVEQGTGLIDLDSAVGVASSISAHGRWRLTFTGEGNHAGTTAMDDRKDPVVAAARATLAAREIAAQRDRVRATVGRVQPLPGGTNVIASQANLWLDVRAESDEATREAIAAIGRAAGESAGAEGCAFEIVEESYGDRVDFDPALRDRIAATLGGAPALATGAGHDAGILGGSLPTAMIFVRNPTGVSHSPFESATDDDCRAGVDALETTVRDLLEARS